MRIWFHRFIIAVLGAAIAAAALFGIEIILALQGNKEPPFVNPSHQPVHLGSAGSALVYVVLGDSTGAGRGAFYDDGIAIGTARHLALRHQVTMTNFSISGAVAEDVVKRELADAVALKPDIVLLSVGANDATHFTSGSALKSQVEVVIDSLQKASPSVKIVVTGCPQMGSIPRFAQPLRWFAGTQTTRVNSVFRSIAASRNITWARIADDTGETFRKDPTLFASDKFHPNKRGYAVWMPTLNRALDSALKGRQ
jgi:lysophospholipase L1-like esterase